MNLALDRNGQKQAAAHSDLSVIGLDRLTNVLPAFHLRISIDDSAEPHSIISLCGPAELHVITPLV